MREFDLNIERVLENWTVAHAHQVFKGAMRIDTQHSAELVVSATRLGSALRWLGKQTYIDQRYAVFGVGWFYGPA